MEDEVIVPRKESLHTLALEVKQMVDRIKQAHPVATRDLSIAITHLETASMFINKQAFTKPATT